ncbi:MAG: thioredoxin domain-containing protein [Bacteroidetes bacterium]|nr:thioredoxin domain-containing protein [Bacteroidota bacterium]
MKNYFFKNRQDGIEIAVSTLLQLHGVHVTETTVRDTLKSHPNFPSLLSISDSFRQWNVDTLALRLSPEQLKEVPLPFIAHLRGHSTSFVVVKELSQDQITYIDDNRKELKVEPNHFYANWDGTVLAVEANSESGEKNYQKNLRKEWWNNIRIPIIVAALFVIGIIQAIRFYFTPAVNVYDTIYFTGAWILNALGVVVTSLLLWYEYDENNPGLKKICSIGAKTNCDAILTSRASKAFKNVSWSEIGFVYFTGSFFYLILGSYNPYFFYPLVLLNVSAAPYILFSVYYQGVIAKQWCVLCLMIQALLFTEFLTAVFTHQVGMNIFSDWRNMNLSAVFIAYFIPAAIWIIAKPYIYKAKEGKQLKYDLVKFKNNAEIFNGLLKQQVAMKADARGLGITIGNPDAENTILKVCNPFCGPCANAHPKIEKLIHENNNWKAQIIFINYLEGDAGTKAAKHLMAIAEVSDRAATNKALDDWYGAEEKKYDVFAKKYPVNGELEKQEQKIQAMHEWCTEEKIEHTPTIYVNGYRLPEQYEITDLNFL